MARREALNPYGSCLAARGRLAARQACAHAQKRTQRMISRAFFGTGPCFSSSDVAIRIRRPRYISQLLAGTPSGPGGSSAAARVPRCDEARRRRTSSRLRDASMSAPLRRTRWSASIARRSSGRRDGASLRRSDKAGHPRSRHPARKSGSRATAREPSGSGYRLSHGMTELRWKTLASPVRSCVAAAAILKGALSPEDLRRED